MAAGITFRIGGALDPSYRGALAQSVAEARAAGVEVNAMQIAQLRAYQATATRINNAIALERLAIFAGKGNSGNLIALQNSAERQATRIANLQTAISIGSFSDYKRIKDARIAGDKAELVSATENLIAQEKAAANYYLNRTLMSSKMRKSLTADNRAIAAAEALWMGQDNGAGIQTSKADLLPLRNELARAIKAKRAPAQAAAQAERWATALAIAQGGGSGVSAGGSHGRRGIAGIIRESTVIGREVMMGRGGGRIAGSVTLLADYMGVLDKAVKSTASPALKAANAASVLSKEMHKAALAAQGTAEGAKLLADAEKQETVAAELATKAKIALANANVTLSATFFGVVGAVVVAAVVIGAIIYSYHKAAVAAKNLADALNPLKQKYTELAEAQDKAAKAAKENADWITNLNNKHESESSQLERKIKLLKEEQAARRRVAEARGASDAELQALDIANLKQEKAMLEVQQKRLETENASAQAAEQAASKAAIAGTTTTDEKGRVINLDQAQSNAKKRGELTNGLAFGQDAHVGVLGVGREPEFSPGHHQRVGVRIDLGIVGRIIVLQPRGPVVEF